MTYTVSITSQGQISLPIQIRRKFFKTNKALVSLKNGGVFIEPVQSFSKLKGSLKTSRSASFDETRKAFEEYLANEGKGVGS